MQWFEPGKQYIAGTKRKTLPSVTIVEVLAEDDVRVFFVDKYGKKQMLEKLEITDYREL